MCLTYNMGNTLNMYGPSHVFFKIGMDIFLVKRLESRVMIRLATIFDESVYNQIQLQIALFLFDCNHICWVSVI